jgi:anthranilate synthase component 2
MLEVTCWTNEADGSIEEIMGVKHKTLAVEGVQFHRINLESAWPSNL